MATKPKPGGLTIVIKLGTSSIVSPEPPYLPHLQLLSSVVETVVKLRELGHRVVICSSGAIGVGLRRMSLKERGKGLSQKQALAAIGQGRLIALWDNLFSHFDQPIAQILLTRMDISDRTRYLNAKNTFSELLQMGVIPIVNENDTVSVSEIKFGDNDTLSAISSAIVHADFLFLLTDVRCLYTDNPRNNPDAKPVRVVRDIQKVRQQVSTTSLGSSLGTGGMSTKLIAAELATAAGTTTVIMHSAHVQDIFGIIDGGIPPSREGTETPRLDEGPLCTRFLRRENPINDRKWWITHGLHTAGTVIIDEGALRAIKRRESGTRLLPAGVVRVEGIFASHQAVKIVVRRRKKLHITGGSGTIPSIRNEHSTDSYDGTDSSCPPSPNTSPAPKLQTSSTDSSPLGLQPATPLLQPVMSLSSSIASLDPLSRSVPPSPAPFVTSMSERLAAASLDSQGVKLVHELAVARGEKNEVVEGDWEELEIGKGLAQYNSSEIDRIKGMKSSHIEQVLGYCDSEHVVDSISFI
ncbi:putative glutamate 5-kinase [Kockovaella imperatae]|uniref:Putative glutamate 5-kinase n=1 Tax=Kockovaella imperatae TaxID=4999 RepID=A0A1Y1UBF1_9TREE|nr:putative glutamate 5-kinase [Kockovaella imperatae]ORX35332.1 putative glutamate 5-kinase [Kockovaella imperatae]